MIVSLLLVAFASGAAPVAPVVAQHSGRAFISPMGEPFHGSETGEDGLVGWFHGADGNHDGKIAFEEFKQDGERFFATLDVNRDGEIDPDEIQRYETLIAPEIRIEMGFSDVSDDEARGGGRLGLLTIPEPVTSADQNFNRGISVPEFDSAARTRFGLLDVNRDGGLTLPELQAMRQAVRSNAKSPRHHKTDQDDQPNSDSGDGEYPGGG
jgi:Ca2+-binding EF-hand superfamily protein